MVSRLRKKDRLCKILDYFAFFFKFGPICLLFLQLKRLKFDDLRGDCKQSVRNILKRKQNNLCAYCERKMQLEPGIEHYFAQKNKRMELKMNNFLGVCSGKYWPNEASKKTEKPIVFCHHKRGSKNLHFHPFKSCHWREITFNEEGIIISSNAEFNIDLNDTLNLNFKELVQERNNSFSNSLDILIELSDKIGWSRKQLLLKGLKASKKGKYEFYHYHIYKFENMLNSI